MSPILANAERELRIRLTNPILPMWDVLVPVFYMLVFGASLDRWLGEEAFGVDYPAFLLAGILAMISFSVALNSSYAFFEEMQAGIFQETLTYPFARRDLLFGKLIFNVSISAVGAGVVLVVAGLALNVAVPLRQVPALVAWTALGTAGWYCFCAWLALMVRGFNAYHTTSSALYLILMFVSNLFYPTERLPDAVRWLAWLNPVTWQVDRLRALVPGGAPSGLEGFGLLAFAVGAFWLADHRLNAPIE